MAVYTTIDDPEAYFQTAIYTGNASNRDITLDGENDMQPAIVWIKERGAVEGHKLFDAVRGATKLLQPSATNFEQTQATSMTAFNSDGFSLGTDSGEIVNENSITHVAWCWKAGTTSGITTNGSTTITPDGYSFDQTAGISILLFDGNGTAGAKLAHGLGKTPEFWQIKRQDEGAESWTGYDAGLGNTRFTGWNGTGNPGTATNRWNDTDPDSVNLTLGSEGSVNSSGNPLMCYAWTSIQGFSRVAGSYIGNGNADGTFVYTGFKPAWLRTKKISGADPWHMYDNKRDVDNPIQQKLVGGTGAESTETAEVDFCANGFKIRTTNTDFNEAGETYTFMAFAEAPFVNSNGVPCNAR